MVSSDQYGIKAEFHFSFFHWVIIYIQENHWCQVYNYNNLKNCSLFIAITSSEVWHISTDPDSSLMPHSS